MHQNETSQKENVTPSFWVAVIGRWLYLAYLTILFKVFHIKDENYNGWFIKKRPILMIIISPVGIPLCMILGIFIYYDWATNYYYHWISGDKRKLNFKEKLLIKIQLSR